MDDLPQEEAVKKPFPLFYLAILTIVPLLILLLFFLFIQKKYGTDVIKEASQNESSSKTSRGQLLPKTSLLFIKDNGVFFKDAANPSLGEKPVLWKGKPFLQTAKNFFAGLSASRDIIVYFEPPETYHIYDLPTSQERTISNLSPWYLLSPTADVMVVGSKDNKILSVDLNTLQSSTLKSTPVNLVHISPDGQNLLASYPLAARGERWIILGLAERRGILWKNDISEDKIGASRYILSANNLILQLQKDALYSQSFNQQEGVLMLNEVGLTPTSSVAASQDGKILTLLFAGKNSSSDHTLLVFDLSSKKIIARHNVALPEVMEKDSYPKKAIYLVSSESALLVTTVVREEKTRERVAIIRHINLKDGRLTMMIDSTLFFAFKPTY